MVYFSKKQNEEEFLKHIKPILSTLKNKKLIISDGDETISIEDTSRIFFELCDNIPLWDKIRKNFKEKGRTHKGYLGAAKIYSKIPSDEYEKYCEETVAQIKFRNFWQELLKLNTEIIVVTSGINLLWNKLIKKNGLKNVTVIGGNNFNEKKFIVTPSIKGLLLDRLKSQNNKIMSFGDSRVDRHLLRNADLGCIVTNARNSPGLVETLRKHNNIVQLKINEEHSDLLPVKNIKEIMKIYNEL